MKTEQVRDILHAAPFRPFRLRTADGKSIPVLHQEVAFLVPKDNLVIIAKEKGGIYLIGTESITHIETVSDPDELQELLKESRG